MLRIRIWTLNWEKHRACLSRIMTHITLRRAIWFCCRKCFAIDCTVFKNPLGKLLQDLCMMESMKEIEHVTDAPSICGTWKQELGRVEEWEEMRWVTQLGKLGRRAHFHGNVVGSILVMSCCGREMSIWKYKYGTGRYKCGFGPQEWAGWEWSLPYKWPKAT